MTLPLLTPKQAAVALGISDRQLRDLTDDGKIPFINVGRGLKRRAARYDPADIDAFKTARKQLKCRSTNVAAKPPTRTTSSVEVFDLAAIRERLQSGKPLLSRR